MRSFRPFVPLLLLPAGLGLLIQMAYLPTLAERLLTLALALFCPELARMAWIDLENIAAIAQEDSRLSRFHKVVVSTIVLEAIGLYGALVSLFWGAAAVVFSQLWFNLLAGIKLSPRNDPAIAPLTVSDRRAVLIADSLGLGIISLWPIQFLQIWLASGLLILITLFATIKYGLSNDLLKASRKSVKPSAGGPSALNGSAGDSAE